MAQYGLWVLAIYGAVALIGLALRLFSNRTQAAISLILVVRDNANTVEAVVRQIIAILHSSRDITINDFFIVEANQEDGTGEILMRLLRGFPQIKLLTTSGSDEDERIATARALSLANGEIVWVLRLEPGQEPRQVVDQLEFLVQRHVSNRTVDPTQDSLN